MALVTPLLSGLLSYVAVTAYRVAIEQRQARALQGALASVIPPAVALEIARDPDRVRMGGERRVISVLFTDLKGFTTFSESVSPEVLSRVITQYLDAMTAVIFRYGGTVDKFIGDAVMAFWNAPLNDPDHARHACLAAMEMQSALRRLGDEWEAEGLPRQYMRVGINTGLVSVGNMGTSQRFAYTALGDTVNLGARLEPLNNEYGTWICLSQATLDAAGGQGAFLVRFLDLVAVKGKKEPVPVYELIGLTHDQSLAQRYAPILEPYHRGMVLYQAQQFEPAREQFLAALRAGEEVVDQPSVVYAERCLEMAEAPPEPDWDGVYVMHHK
jgi:adenylate cyclase